MPGEVLKALLEWLKSSLANILRPVPAVPATISVPVDNSNHNNKRANSQRCTARPAGLRRPRGSALSEFGPALFFIFIFAVFPVLDIIGLCFGYISCCTMNDLQLREAAKLPKSVATLQTGTVYQDIPQQFMATLMGSFSGLTDLPQTTVTYTPGQTAVYVNVATTVTVRPFLTIPFFVKVPGLGEPTSFTVSNTRVLENPAFAVQ